MRSSQQNVKYRKLNKGIYIINTTQQNLEASASKDWVVTSRTASGTLKVAHGGNLKTALKSVPLNRCFRRRYFLSTRASPLNPVLKPGARMKLEQGLHICFQFKKGTADIFQFVTWMFSQHKLHCFSLAAFFLSYTSVTQFYLMFTIGMWNARNRQWIDLTVNNSFYKTERKIRFVCSSYYFRVSLRILF